jgi:hypothetical protein
LFSIKDLPIRSCEISRRQKFENLKKNLVAEIKETMTVTSTPPFWGTPLAFFSVGPSTLHGDAT